jgi:hypothetical protein
MGAVEEAGVVVAEVSYGQQRPAKRRTLQHTGPWRAAAVAGRPTLHGMQLPAILFAQIEQLKHFLASTCTALIGLWHLQPCTATLQRPGAAGLLQQRLQVITLDSQI